MSIRIVGEALPNLPWQDRPAGCGDVIWRNTENPITGWNPTPQTARVFNSAVVPFDRGFAGVFRADHRDGKARLHAGFSTDGLQWSIEDGEIRWIDESGKPWQPNYAYDPRVVRLGDAWYVTWCTDFGGAALGLGMTRDFRTFVRLENPMVPFTRNGVLFPRKVHDRYLLLSRPSDGGHTAFGDIFLSESPDLVHWGRHRRVMTRGGSGWWQELKIGAGPIPVETDEGWLLLYHGVTRTCNGYVYSMGGAVLDAEEPSVVRHRSRGYLLTPETAYETTGFVPNVVFPCATLVDAPTGRMTVYYGAADTVTGIAHAHVGALIDHIRNDSELLPGDGMVCR